MEQIEHMTETKPEDRAMRIISVRLECGLKLMRIIVLAAISILGLVVNSSSYGEDILYVGDSGDNSVKRFDAVTGRFLDVDLNPANDPDAFVRPGSGGLAGPRGILLDGNLLVVNQNVNLGIPGEVLRYDSLTGAFLGKLVSSGNKNAPFVPRGIVRDGNDVLYVAELTTANGRSPGRLPTYAANGAFIRDLTFARFPAADRNPRSVVFGPDGFLYVSLRNLKNDGLGGHVVRFTAAGTFAGVFIEDTGGVGRLNRPEGLVFGPDGRLYVTSFQANPQDTDSIRIYDAQGTFVDKIPLNLLGETRAFAQALLFGPGGRLFVAVTSTGEVRSYDVATKAYTSFVPTTATGGALKEPWYMTFGQTDPATLSYVESGPQGSGPNLVRCFCGNGAVVDFCAALDCFSSPEQDAICGPGCAPRGGETGTACFPLDNRCPAATPTGLRQPAPLMLK
ncbi:NHL repeat-containing protein [Pseudomonas sp. BN414]|uniref:NHL repeat-containing protein n=1 Tax=Pseudomonas sp. BN414 TaxID=2567888 RepID=UPI0024550641|nr:NHL repeat-containing protein [Pseudomonas sp. BN414]